MTEVKNLNLLPVLILGIIIRLLLMPFYFHPDIKTYHFQSSFLKSGVLNIYSYLEEKKAESPIKEEFVYFPLTYYSLGFYQIVATPLLGANFDSWVKDASQTYLKDPLSFRYLVLLKLPYLILDLLISILFLKLFQTTQEKRLAFKLWLLNPFTPVLIYVFSNVDIIPVFLSLLSFYLLIKDQKILSAIFLGVASGFKVYPLLLLPALISYQKDIRQKVIYTLTALGTLTALILPFLFQPGFKEAALVSGLTTRALLSKLDIGFGESLILPIIAVALITIYLIKNNSPRVFINAFTLLAVFLSLIHFHIQWLLWVAPFAVYLSVKYKITKELAIISVLAFLIPILYEDRFMSFGLLSPISLYFNLLPLPQTVAAKIYDPHSLMSILHSLLAALVLFKIWEIKND